MPIVAERKAIGRLRKVFDWKTIVSEKIKSNRVSQMSFFASSRISIQLFNSANNGAIGKAATKIVIKPNCRTKSNSLSIEFEIPRLSYPFRDIRNTKHWIHFV